MRRVPAGRALRPDARLRRLYGGFALPGVRAFLRARKLRSVQDKLRLRRHDPELLARQPDVPPRLHEQPAVRSRRQCANLQCEHRGLRRLQRIRRLPDRGKRLRGDDAAVCPVLERCGLRRNIDAGMPSESLCSMRDEWRLSKRDAVLRPGRGLSRTLCPMPSERPMPTERANVQQWHVWQIRELMSFGASRTARSASPCEHDATAR